MSPYAHLLAPGRIGALELRNRMVMAPMGEDLGDLDGMVSPTQMAYLEARARGGLAMVMLGSVAVSFPVGCSNARQTAISDDRHIAGWREAATRVHRHGSTIAMQLTQAGMNSLQDTLAGRPMWVASEPGPPGRDDLYGMVTADEGAKMMEPFLGPDSKLYYKVLDHDDIASVIDDFASAVVRAREAGVDGCELHAGHGYLIDGFLSPAKNHRTDEYGGPVEHRARILVEILQEIRRRVGDDYAVWCRLNSTENRPDGMTLDDCITIARLAQDAGADAVHVSAYHDPASATGPTDSYAPQMPGLLIENARCGEGGARRAGDRGRPDHPRRRRRRHRRRGLRLRVDGAHDPRRARAAQPARGREAGGDPAVRVPLPLHRQHLRARSGAVRGERLGRSRGRARHRYRAVTAFGAGGRRRAVGHGGGARRGVAGPLGHAGRRRAASRWTLGLRGRDLRHQRRPAAVVRAPARAARGRRAARYPARRRRGRRDRRRRGRRGERRAVGPTRAPRCRPPARARGRRARLRGCSIASPLAGQRRRGAGRRPARARGGRAGRAGGRARHRARGVRRVRAPPRPARPVAAGPRPAGRRDHARGWRRRRRDHRRRGALARSRRRSRDPRDRPSSSRATPSPTPCSPTSSVRAVSTWTSSATPRSAPDCSSTPCAPRSRPRWRCSRVVSVRRVLRGSC